MALLRSENVVLYHPLNDRTEFTQTDQWTGNSNFLIAKILSGVTVSDVASLGSFDIITTSGLFRTSISNIEFINSSGVVAIYSRTTPDSFDQAKLGTVSGLNIIWQSGSVDLVNDDRVRYSILRLSDRQFIASYGWFGPAQNCKVGTITSSGIVFGSAASYSTSDLLGASVAISSSGFLVIGTKSTSNFIIRAGNVTGSGTTAAISFGSNFDVGSGTVSSRGPSIALFPTRTNNISSGILFWNEYNTTRLMATHITISGVTITRGNDYQISSDFNAFASAADSIGFTSAVALDDSTAAVIYCDQNIVDTKNVLRVVRASGNTLIASGPRVVADSTLFGFGLSKLAAPDQSNRRFLLLCASGISNIGRYGVYEDGQLQLGNRFTIHPSGSYGTYSIYNPFGKAVIGYASGFIGVNGIISQVLSTEINRTDIRSSNSNLYPTMSGVTRLLAGAWMKHPTINNTRIFIERGYQIAVSGSQVRLGQSGVQWDVNVSGMFPNGSPKLLLLYFENQGVSNPSGWRLHTSIDGTPWIDRGLQTSGNLGVISTNTTPSLTIEASGVSSSQWVDELVLYKNIDKFTDLELSNLHTLGDVLSLPMSEYSSFFTSQPSGSIGLSVRGKLPFSGSMPCFMTGPATTSGSTNLSMLSKDTVNGSVPLSFHFPSLILDNLDLLISGPLVLTSNIDMSINGIGRPSGSVSITLLSTNLASSSGNLFIHGRSSVSSSINLSMIQSRVDSDISLSIEGSNIRPRNLFWIDAGSSKLYRSDLDGGSVSVIADGIPSMQYLIANPYNELIHYTDFNVSNKIRKIGFDGSGLQTIVTNVNTTVPLDVDIDQFNQKLYWTDVSSNTIKRCNFDGSNIETINTFVGTFDPVGIAIDTMNAKIYWIDSDLGYIRRSNLDGSNISNFINVGMGARQIDIDMSGSKIFWTDEDTSSIYCSSLGNGSTQVIADGSDGIISPLGITVDPEVQKIYWTDNSLGTVNRMNYDGTSISVIYSGLVDPQGIAVDKFQVGFNGGSSSGLVFSWSIENLLRAGNYNPQLVGSLDYIGVSGDVYIQIWDIRLGNPIEIPLSNSGCYPIGSTGRWGFSTQYIPPSRYDNPQYFYRMTAPNTNDFQGQFFVNTRQRMPRDNMNTIRNII